MLMVQSMKVNKSVVFVRRGDAILLFRHPLAGVQLPKGTVEPGETTQAAARREVFEEVGLSLTRPLPMLGTWICPSPSAIWHVFMADAPTGTLEAWRHAPTGGGPEAGLVFDVFWADLPRARKSLHPLFLPVLGMIERHAGLR